MPCKLQKANEEFHVFADQVLSSESNVPGADQELTDLSLIVLMKRKSFKIVYIPADESQEMTEWAIEIPKKGDEVTCFAKDCDRLAA